MVSELCSFHKNVSVHESSTLKSVVDVMLGCSEIFDDVECALKYGPILFISYLSGTELANAIGRVICSYADNFQTSFTITTDEISDLIEYYLEYRFHESSTSRIGARESYNFQRLVYNTAAIVVSFYENELQNQKRSQRECVLALRRASDMIASLADAVKSWMPAGPWAKNAGWTKWHVLSYVLEMTLGTVLRLGNEKWHGQMFLIFCDTIAGKALEETHSSFCITEYNRSSFSWIACSNSWNAVLRCCERENNEFMTNASSFLKLSSEMFNEPQNSRPPSPPPDTRKRAAAHSSPNAERKRAFRTHCTHRIPLK